MNAAVPALALYRYRSASDYYSNGDILTGGNWWSRGMKTMQYGRMILYGLAFLFQFITVLGHWANWNMSVWLLLIGLLNPIVNVFFIAFELIALVQAKELAHDSSQSASMINQATALETQVSEDLLKFVVGAIGSSLVLLWNGDNWLAG